jgi:antitoxin (DNA-binding transcriptional repressor) of toxin-antitoxin stability system
MVNVVFVSVTDISRTGTRVIMDMEKTGHKVAITKLGKPVALLQKATGTEKGGKRETVSNLRNNALAVIAKIEKTGKRLIITRDGVPIALLTKVTDDAFSVDGK